MRLVTVVLTLPIFLSMPATAAEQKDDIRGAVEKIKQMLQESEQERKRKEELRNLISQASWRAGHKVHAAIKQAGMNIDICYNIDNPVKLSQDSSRYAKRRLMRLEDKFGLNVIEKWEQCRRVKEKIFVPFFKKELKSTTGITLTQDSFRSWVEQYLDRSVW